MAGAEAASPESLDVMQTRHRKELRDLQSRIASKKRNATKKTRKGINDECAALEQQLKERQEQELSVLAGDAAPATGTESDDDDKQQISPNGLSSKLQATSISSPPTEPPAPKAPVEGDAETTGGGGKKKRNRQKERLARRAAEVEAAAAAAEEEAKNMVDHRKVESAYMTRQFEEQGLVEHEIRPDGHCLFSAVADQIKSLGFPIPTLASDAANEKGEGYKMVRKAAAQYIRDHPDDFAPFLEEPLESYTNKIENTAEWGGHMELQALARTYGIRISVIQDGRTEVVEPEDAAGEEQKGIWLAYYRHGYGLGEHYNSLRKKS